MWNDPAFMCYMMECEGETDTHEGKVNKFIKLLNVDATPWEESSQATCLSMAGLRLEDLCPRDLERIRRETGESL